MDWKKINEARWEPYAMKEEETKEDESLDKVFKSDPQRKKPTSPGTSQASPRIRQTPSIG